MKVHINEYDFDLRYSMRMFINYEAIIGKSLAAEDLQKYTNFIALFFSCVVASAAYHKIQLNLTYEDFINWMDENGGELMLLEFGEWYMKAAQANAALISKSTKEGSEQHKEKKS